MRLVIKPQNDWGDVERPLVAMHRNVSPFVALSFYFYYFGENNDFLASV